MIQNIQNKSLVDHQSTSCYKAASCPSVGRMRTDITDWGGERGSIFFFFFYLVFSVMTPDGDADSSIL